MISKIYTPALTVDRAVAIYYQHAQTRKISRARQLKLPTLAGHWRAVGCEQRAGKITTADFNRFREAALAKGMKPITIETHIALMRTVLRHVGPNTSSTPRALGLIGPCPWIGDKLMIETRVEPPIPTEHLRAVYRACKDAMWAPPDCDPCAFFRAWLVIGYNTGLRYGDLTERLSRSMIDRQNMMISIVPHKTERHGKKLLLPLNQIMIDHLDTLPDRGPDVPIFIAIKTRYQPDLLRKTLTEICKAANVPRFTAQGLRRTAGNAYSAVDTIAGSMLLGHTLPKEWAASTITWTHYIQSLETVLRPAQSKIPQPWTTAPELQSKTE